jgi:hypothetical protein
MLMERLRLTGHPEHDYKIRPAITLNSPRNPKFCPRCGRRKREWRSLSAEMLCLECEEREDREDREEPGFLG